MSAGLPCCVTASAPQALANRAAALCRSGRFPEALSDFEEAIELLKGMNYPSLQAETYLFWGYEYSSVLEHWEDARAQFAEVAKIVERQPDSYIEERARLLIGLGQVELSEGYLEKAEYLLQEAKGIVETRDLNWWRPVVDDLLKRLALARRRREQAN